MCSIRSSNKFVLTVEVIYSVYLHAFTKLDCLREDGLTRDLPYAIGRAMSFFALLT